MKSIEEIKEEVARESGFHNWSEHKDTGIYNSEVDLISRRHSQQYIDANKELVEMLEELLPLAEDGYKLHKSNGCHQDFLEDDRETLKKAKSLITKHKQS